MKKVNFLIKLKKENRLEIVEPSEELKQSYIKKSESNLESSKILLDNNKLEESISLTYYSMYHILTALLFKTGIKCENHSGSIILLKEIFDLNNSDISEAKTERIDKQYYTDFKITKEEITEAIKNAEIFNANLFDFISKLSNESIKKYRDKFSEL
ncbi:MAG: HEPN domain-containing protein [Nanoarchaeota archaeon]|nr:HEPN domain-containing protein [Nanoarchaeota archaeon]MBU1052135.1 HEPN domain-containing protein [Nanoarchaeota archaeon]MBU1987859.1 HEPN domain-containing protein [Nanoarchaeota archaeon]